MKTSIFIVAILISVFQSDWIRYSDDNYGFSVLVPGQMDHTIKEIITDVGTITFNTYQHAPKSDDRNEIYVVHHYQYPDSILSSDTTFIESELLETTVEESITRLNGKLDYSRPIKYKEYQGILYRIKYNGGKAVLKSKAFVIEDNVFVLQVYAIKENSINNLMDYFLDSFQHMDRKI